MKTAILYTRSDKSNRYSKMELAEQLKFLRLYCEKNQIQIVSHFEDCFSGEDFDRPGWNSLSTYLKKARRGKVNFILFTRWDRFTQNVAYTFDIINRLKKRKIHVKAIFQPIDLPLPVPERNYLLATFIAHATVERELKLILENYNQLHVQ